MAIDLRKELLLKFSQVFSRVIKLVNMVERNLEGSFSSKHFASRHMSLSMAINSVIDRQLADIEAARNMGYCKVNRHKAQLFQDEGNIDHEGKYSIFGQIMQQLKRDGKLDL